MQKLTYFFAFAIGLLAARYLPQVALPILLVAAFGTSAVFAATLYLQHRPRNSREETLLFLFGTFNPFASLERGRVSQALVSASAVFAGSVAGLLWRSHA